MNNTQDSFGTTFSNGDYPPYHRQDAQIHSLRSPSLGSAFEAHYYPSRHTLAPGPRRSHWWRFSPDVLPRGGRPSPTSGHLPKRGTIAGRRRWLPRLVSRRDI